MKKPQSIRVKTKRQKRQNIQKRRLSKKSKQFGGGYRLDTLVHNIVEFNKRLNSSEQDENNIIQQLRLFIFGGENLQIEKDRHGHTALYAACRMINPSILLVSAFLDMGFKITQPSGPRNAYPTHGAVEAGFEIMNLHISDDEKIQRMQKIVNILKMLKEKEWGIMRLRTRPPNGITAPEEYRLPEGLRSILLQNKKATALLSDLDDLLKEPRGGMSAMTGDPSLYDSVVTTFVNHHKYFTNTKPNGEGVKYWVVDSDNNTRYFTPEINNEINQKILTTHASQPAKSISFTFGDGNFSYTHDYINKSLTVTVDGRIYSIKRD
jgi:hypothetical protein